MEYETCKLFYYSSKIARKVIIKKEQLREIK